MPRHHRIVWIAGLGLMLAGPAAALFKVVGPDGRVTYTDRPPSDTAARVTPLGKESAAAANSVTALPAELREATAKYPVTFYATPDCSVCDEARRALQQRGVPYTERRVENADDTQAFERLTGGRTVPALTIGAQVLRGWNGADWQSYLDAAGYPRESRLPRGWPPAPVSPLTARASAPPPDEPPRQVPLAPRPVDAQPVPAPSGIRF